MSPRVVDHDNRGASGVMFGFVYFDDDTRVAYATGHGVTGDTGGWAEITPSHVRAARRYLNKVAPEWNATPASA